MDFDFEQISSMLNGMSEEDLQNLTETAQSIFGAFGTAREEPAAKQQTAPTGGIGGMFTPELLATLSQLMQHMNRNDPRTDLILALKPHLSNKRQHRAEQAIQMMKMLDLVPMLQQALQ
ncbi:MAG: hypothetical protein LBB67_07435 [Oscillospiraceae bacterium]|nr:hypothetical protein [Oscillospiraceae bacterium]